SWRQAVPTCGNACTEQYLKSTTIAIEPEEETREDASPRNPENRRPRKCRRPAGVARPALVARGLGADGRHAHDRVQRGAPGVGSERGPERGEPGVERHLPDALRPVHRAARRLVARSR